MSLRSHPTLERIMFDSYGKLLSIVVRECRDIMLAEDALSGALLRAITRWPEDGVPENPEAWLVTVARNSITDAVRSDQAGGRAIGELLLRIEEDLSRRSGGGKLPDERLQLLFALAHPAIDPATRAPLMVQVALGLPTERVASAFMVSPAVMAKRLSRIKAKIRDARIPLQVPEEDLESRLHDVLNALYAIYGTGWDGLYEGGLELSDLRSEALYLSEQVVLALPGQPEALGLAALLLYCESRTVARCDRNGEYLPLDVQPTALWDNAFFSRAEELLRSAFRSKRFGRFQIEAAIQSAHMNRRLKGVDTRQDVVRLYRELIVLNDSPSTELGLIAALHAVRETQEARKRLDRLSVDIVNSYQPYWAVRAEVYRALGEIDEARTAYERAIALSQSAAIRRFLRRQIEER